jgi:hypothetical protein
MAAAPTAKGLPAAQWRQKGGGVGARTYQKAPRCDRNPGLLNVDLAAMLLMLRERPAGLEELPRVASRVWPRHPRS